MAGHPRYDHLGIAAFVSSGWTPHEASDAFDCPLPTVRRVLKDYGVRPQKPWCRTSRRCMAPDCPYTKDGATSKPPWKDGLCRSCGGKRRYRGSPEVRAGVWARAKRFRLSDPERANSYYRAYKERHPERVKAAQRRHRRLKRAEGFDPVLIRGTLVDIGTSDNEGNAVTARVVRRYARNGVALCDLENHRGRVTGIPMAGLSLVPEKVKGTGLNAH